MQTFRCHSLLKDSFSKVVSFNDNVFYQFLVGNGNTYLAKVKKKMLQE